MFIHRQPIKILFIAAEAEPLVKVGGLGDVAGSLPRALSSLSLLNPEGEFSPVDIRLAIPLHGGLDVSRYEIKHTASFDIDHQDGPIPARVYETAVNGLRVYLVSGRPFSPAAPVYSNNNHVDGHKFTFFSLACLQLAREIGWKPDVLHANDWHSAPAVYALAARFAEDEFFRGTATLLTIHNLPYLGAGGGPALRAFCLPPASGSQLPWWAQDLPLPLGLLAADHITAVSPTYAREILTPEYGSGLHDFLQTRAGSISGILNGIDLDSWNAGTDPQLACRFEAGSIGNRSVNKETLQRELGFDIDPNALLFGMINRMDTQKGVDIALQALRSLTQQSGPQDQPWQAVILGTGMPELEQAARQMEADFPGRVRAVLQFDACLSRRIYAGADLLLLPSRYEPCGLAQMIAMRYGCIPLAHATGGLRDTIYDEDFEKTWESNGTGSVSTGFLFKELDPAVMASTMRRAMRAFSDREHWQHLQVNGMRQDFSWERSARQYLQLYQKLTKAQADDAPGKNQQGLIPEKRSL